MRNLSQSNLLSIRIPDIPLGRQHAIVAGIAHIRSALGGLDEGVGCAIRRRDAVEARSARRVAVREAEQVVLHEVNEEFFDSV
jgi:hypothetical protein